MLSYSAAGGPANNGHVSFNRAESDFLHAGTRTLNIASNGGLTIVAVVRFTGSAGTWERIIGFDNGGVTCAGSDLIVLARIQSQNIFGFQVYNGGSKDLHFSFGPMAQDTWYTIIARYDASTLAAEVRVDGVVVGTGTASAALTDRTVSKTYVGRKSCGPHFLNADMAGLLVVDQYLDLDTAVAHAHSMEAGTHYTCQGIVLPSFSLSSCPSVSSSSHLIRRVCIPACMLWLLVIFNTII